MKEPLSIDEIINKIAQRSYEKGVKDTITKIEKEIKSKYTWTGEEISLVMNDIIKIVNLGLEVVKEN